MWYIFVFVCFALSGSNVKYGRMSKYSWHKLHSLGCTLHGVIKHFVGYLSSFSLTFRTLFQNEFSSFSDLSKEQLLDTFKG